MPSLAPKHLPRLSKSIESLRAALYAKIDAVQDDFSARGWLPARLNLNKGVVRGLIELFAWGQWQVYTLLDRVLGQAVPQTASAGWLDVHADSVDLQRRPATKAQGLVLFLRSPANSGNVKIPAGRIVRTKPDGKGEVFRYVTTADAVLPAGADSVAVPISGTLEIVMGDPVRIRAAAEARILALFADVPEFPDVSPLQIGEDLTLDRLTHTVMAVAPVRCRLSRVYNTEFDFRPAVWGADRWSDAWWSLYSGVPLPDAPASPGGDAPLVSFGARLSLTCLPYSPRFASGMASLMSCLAPYLDKPVWGALGRGHAREPPVHFCPDLCLLFRHRAVRSTPY